MLSEKAGIYSNNDQIFMGVINVIWDVDDASKRPEIFDKVLLLPPQEEESRKEILQIGMKKVPVDKIDLADVAKPTFFFQGRILTLCWRKSQKEFWKILFHTAMRDGLPKMISKLFKKTKNFYR